MPPCQCPPSMLPTPLPCPEWLSALQLTSSVGEQVGGWDHRTHLTHWKKQTQCSTSVLIRPKGPSSASSAERVMKREEAAEVRILVSEATLLFPLDEEGDFYYLPPLPRPCHHGTLILLWNSKGFLCMLKLRSPSKAFLKNKISTHALIPLSLEQHSSPALIRNPASTGVKTSGLISLLSGATCIFIRSDLSRGGR